MFLHLPDVPTLRLCSLLATMSYATIFVVLWLRRRGETYLLYWGMSSALYAAALFAFEISHARLTPLSAALDYGLLALSDFLLLAGVRRFDRKRTFPPWMAIPIGITMAAVAAPLSLIADPAWAATIAHVAGGVALGGCMVVCALAILVGRPPDSGLPRTIVAVALLAYGPGYLLSIWIELRGTQGSTTLDLLPMLQDQVLLGVLNLGLLATPWERALRQLMESARRDPLTGVSNRTELKQQETALAIPRNSLFLIDIDHFKEINDTFGHAAGDAVLIAFSAQVQALARARGGMFVRLGGDEFMLVAPTANDSEAQLLAEQVRAVPGTAIAGLPPYSLCVGIARVGAGERNLSQAMARADQSLYRAKSGGRNRVGGLIAA